jgi:DNA-binding NarL/FixJ family response regulator
MRNPLGPEDALIPVTVISDRPILLNALRRTLGSISDIDSAGEIGQIAAGPEGGRSRRIVILEQRQWTSEGIAEAVRSTSAGVIAWLPSLSPEIALTSLQLGVQGVLGDRCSEHDIEQCVTVVSCGGSWIPQEVNTAVLSRRMCKLTPREAELITLLASGLRNKEIAFALGITEGTVKVYLSKIFTKLGVADRFELALFALRSVGVLPSRAEEDNPAAALRAARLHTIPRSVFPLKSAGRITADQGSAPYFKLTA